MWNKPTKNAHSTSIGSNTSLSTGGRTGTASLMRTRSMAFLRFCIHAKSNASTVNTKIILNTWAWRSPMAKEYTGNSWMGLSARSGL